MLPPVRQKVMRHLNIVGQLQPALHEQTHAPSPDMIDNAHFRAYTRSAHDVGGEPDIESTKKPSHGSQRNGPTTFQE